MSSTVKFVTVASIIIAIISLGIMTLVEVPTKTKVTEAGGGGIVPAGELVGGDFILHDVNGNIVDSKQFRGKYLLIYFGFTFCPDICPASLSEMGLVIDDLAQEANLLQPIFITIDPKRDTQAQLKEYFTHFNPAILPLTGSAEEIKQVATSFKVYYSVSHNTKNDPENYLVDHSSFFYFVGPDGRLIKYYTSKVPASDIATDILTYMKGH
jgi:protein SCO1/2